LGASTKTVRANEVMDRRSFLRGFGGGLVATATMAEAGMLAEFFDWLKRKPVWSFPSKTSLSYDDLNAATMRYIVPCLHDHVFKTSPIFMKLRKMPQLGQTGSDFRHLYRSLEVA
jgi:hypothetical protein